jgi:hypothetical protein
MTGIQNLTFSRGARLITGAAPTDFNLSKEVSEIKPGAGKCRALTFWALVSASTQMSLGGEVCASG